MATGEMGRAALPWERLVLTAHGLNPQSSKSYVQSQNNSIIHYCLPGAQPLPDPTSPSVFLAGIQLPSLDQHLELQNPGRVLHKEQRNVELGYTARLFQPQPVLCSLPVTHSRDKPARPSPLMCFSSSSEPENFFPSSGYKTPSCQQLTSLF